MKKNQPKLLILRDPPEGFFSNYFYVLEGIWVAQNLGLEPIVCFPISLCASQRKSGSVIETWSDYFDVKEELGTHHYSEQDSQVHSQFLGLLREFTLERISALANECLPLKQKVKEEFEAERKRSFGVTPGPILGVHFRGGDMYWHPSHPTPPTMTQMIMAMNTALATGYFSSVFVATDSPTFVKRLQKRVKVPVKTIAHSRSLNLGWRSRDSVRNVLLDAHILSRCEGLVHSSSNVSFAARLFRGTPYQHRIQIGLGVNPSSLRIAVLNAIWRMCVPEILRGEKPELIIEGTIRPAGN